MKFLNHKIKMLLAIMKYKLYYIILYNMEYIYISIEDVKKQIKWYDVPQSDIELKLSVFAIYDYRISSKWGYLDVPLVFDNF